MSILSTHLSLIENKRLQIVVIIYPGGESEKIQVLLERKINHRPVLRRKKNLITVKIKLNLED